MTTVFNGGFANCAAPCYYAACGIGSPGVPPLSEPNYQLQWTIADSNDVTKAERRIPFGGGSLVLFDSLPFYMHELTAATTRAVELN